MKLIITLAVFLLFGCLAVNSQNLQWIRHMGGANTDYGFDVATDTSNNVYSVGMFIGTAVIGNSTLVSQGFNDHYLMKANSAGQYVWTIQISGDYPGKIVADPAGNIFWCGNVSSSIIINTTTIVAQNPQKRNILLIKFSPSGSILWHKQFSGTNYLVASGITCDPAGDVIFTGQFDDTAVFTPHTLVTTHTLGSQYVAKISNGNGSVLWAKKINTVAGGAGLDITTDPTGNVYCTGYSGPFKNLIGPGPFPPIYKNTLVLKRNGSNGDSLWQKEYPGINNSCLAHGNSLVVEGGYVFSGGLMTGTVNFNGTILSTISGKYDAVMLQSDASTGTLSWAKNFGQNVYDEFYMSSDKSGRIYSMIVIPGPSVVNGHTFTPVDHASTYILQTDLNGNISWSKEFQGGFAVGAGIINDRNGSLYVNGWFTDYFTVESQTLVTSTQSGTDIVLMKFFPAFTGLKHNQTEETISIGPNPFSEKIFLTMNSSLAVKTIQVYDQSGRLCYSASGNVTEIDLHGHEKGLYYLKLETIKGETITKKLLRN